MTKKTFAACLAMVGLLAPFNTVMGGTPPTTSHVAVCQETMAQDWTGSYQAEYCAGETVGGTPICFILEFTLTKLWDGSYRGDLGVDGYQTYVRCTITAEEEDGQLKVYYNAPIEERGFWDGEKGQLLVTLKKGRKGRTVAIWSDYLIEKDMVVRATTIKKIKSRTVVD